MRSEHHETENFHKIYDVGPKTSGVQRGLKMKDLRDLEDFDDTRYTTHQANIIGRGHEGGATRRGMTKYLSYQTCPASQLKITTHTFGPKEMPLGECNAQAISKDSEGWRQGCSRLRLLSSATCSV